MRNPIHLLAACLALSASVRADDAESFSRRVEPLLAKRCLECHGADRKGGLDLRTRETLLRGGENGPMLVPGKPDQSRLVEVVTAGEMPPKKPLTKDEIGVLRDWIASGAWFPDRPLDPYAFSTEHRAGYDWWSLQPVRPMSLPAVKSADAVRSPLDAFLLAKLEARGLAFSPLADRTTFIRRVTFDLTGLAPTYDEVNEFVRDPQPDAEERLVDRLLASPHYGERWGRHWLDVVRFAESNGFERDRIRRNFWPYRDYVIRSFNADKPYDRFVREQLAGDALDDGDESRIATGFLVAGPKNDVGTISPLEQMQTRQDELDEFVVATGTTFLALTVGCSRCHDHKFDPIPSRDYYALTAVFNGVRHENVTLMPPAERQRRDALAAEIRQQTDAAKQQRADLVAWGQSRALEARKKSSPDAQPDSLPAVNSRRNEDPFPPATAKFVRFTVTRSSNAQPCLDELELFGPDAEKNLALAGKATASSLLPGYPIHQINHLNDGRYGNSASWISNELGGWAQIELPEAARIQRVVWGRDREGKFTDRVPVEYRIEISLDGREWTRVSDSSRRGGPANPPTEAEALAALSPSERATAEQHANQIAALAKRLTDLPPLPTTYAAADSGGQPTAAVLRRGDVRSPGESVAAAALSAIPFAKTDLSAKSGSERRRLLADWIVDARHPLTARVLVNRLWQHHFGRGIVDTPSDFGFNGGRPTHPELLDWLAHDFVTHDWELKRLHRQIVLSTAYRQSSLATDRGLEIDADNRRLWRFTPRRLEAEVVRDAVLQASGSLRRTLGGPSFELFRYRDGNVPDYILLDKGGPETWRRAVYAYNIRTFQAPLMAAFDCPDASLSTPSRVTTTSPLQALSLLNNAFVVEQANLLAERIRVSTSDPVVAAYRHVLHRDPTAAELARAAAFLNEHGLAGLCRVLMNANEFLYVF